MKPLILAVVVLAACKRDTPPPEKPDPTIKHARPDKRTPPPPECAADDECVLMPELSCCGECPPVAPYEAVTRGALDAALIEDEQDCALDDVDCDAFACSGAAPGCAARAACVEGQCAVASSGC